jgi:hypothetical protein
MSGGGKPRRYRTNQPRGNEPGGVNGQYGRFGQTPGMQPSAAFNGQVDAQRKGFGGRQRYGQPQGIVGGSSQQSNQQQAQGGAAGARQQAPQSPTPQPGQENNPYYQSGQYDRDKETWMQQNVQQQSAAQTSPFGGGEAPFSGAAGPRQGATGISGGAGASNQQQAAQGMGGGMSRFMGQMQQAQPQMSGPQETEQGKPSPQTAAAAPSQPSFSSPFGNMRFGSQPQAMESGGMVTEPTLAMLGENGPEVVVPMGGNPNAKITPGMMQPRDTFNTGPSSLGKPLHGLAPTAGPMSNQKFPRYGA